MGESTRPTREQAFDAFCTLLAFAAAQGSEPARDTVVTVDDWTQFPGLTRRVLADAMRSTAIPSFKVGRKLAAKRADVEQWIESRKVTPRTRRATPAPDNTDPAAAYLALVGGSR